MGDAFIEERVPAPPEPGRRRVRSRARSLAAEGPRIDDPAAAAHALLRDSDARKIDPAVRNLRDGRVERRTSRDATPPPDGARFRRARSPKRERAR